MSGAVVALGAALVLAQVPQSQAAPNPCAAYGGTGYTSVQYTSGKCQVTFSYSGSDPQTSYSWTVPSGLTSADVVVVGGGGGGAGGETAGANYYGGSGGGGGNVTVGSVTFSTATVVVKVGKGGAGGASAISGSAGEASQFDALVASGGGGGDAVNTSSPTSSRGGGSGRVVPGESPVTTTGGTSMAPFASVQSPGGAGAGAGQTSDSDAGGSSYIPTEYGSPDVNARQMPGDSNNGSAGYGGNGYAPNQGLFSTSSTYYGGGGGGGSTTDSNVGWGGYGGGARGVAGVTVFAANAGTSGTGGGGGGGFAGASGKSAGGAGGSGVVVIRFSKPVLPLSVTTSSLPNGTVGTAYSQVLSASGGSESYPNWQVTSGTLPAGLDLNQATGTIYGTPTAAGTSTFSLTVTDSDDTTSPAKSLSLTIVASGGGGGGSSDTSGGGSTPTPSSSASASASPSVAPSAPARLDPAAPGSNPNLPAGGLPAGGSVFLVNGQPVPLQVAPNSQSDPVALVFRAPGMNMRLEGRGDANDPLGLTSKQALILQSEPGTGSTSAGSVQARSAKLAKAKVRPVAQTSGDGFAANSPVKLFILPSTYLGQVTTDAKGAFAGAVPIPAGITPGVYTLQANGFAPDFSVRSLSIGVLVQPTATRTKTTRGKVFFDVLSPALSNAAKAKLRQVAAKAKAGATRSVVVGYVQGTSSSGNDRALSTARAQAVAAYLRSLGVKGVYVVRGDGKANEAGAQARRVNVAITYRA